MPVKSKEKSIGALATVELNSYIVILTPPKHKKLPSSSGAKAIFFSFIATVAWS